MNVKYLFLFFLTLFIAACTTLNTQKTFNNQVYILNKNSTANRFFYLQKDNPKKVIVIEKREVPVALEQYVEKRIDKEQKYRKQDCSIKKRSLDRVEYYLCQYQKKPSTIVYYFEQAPKQTVITKIFVSKNSRLNEKEIRSVVNELINFK